MPWQLKKRNEKSWKEKRRRKESQSLKNSAQVLLNRRITHPKICFEPLCSLFLASLPTLYLSQSYNLSKSLLFLLLLQLTLNWLIIRAEVLCLFVRAAKKMRKVLDMRRIWWALVWKYCLLLLTFYLLLCTLTIVLPTFVKCLVLKAWAAEEKVICFVLEDKLA